jgi:Flp pilus assembly CpaF family ATPase
MTFYDPFRPAEEIPDILNRSTRATTAQISEPAIRYIRDVVRGSGASASGSAIAMRAMLDPFGSPFERYRAFADFIIPRIREHHQRGGELATLPADPSIIPQLYRETIGWGAAQPFFDQPGVDEVRIIGNEIIVSEAGRYPMKTSVVMTDPADVLARILQLADATRTQLDVRHPQATIAIPDSRTRIHVTIPPRSDAPYIIFRRGRTVAWTVSDLTAYGMITADGERLLDLLIHMGVSIMIAGPTGSGKSTVMASLVNQWAVAVLPIVRNAIVIEESREMQFDPRAFVVRLLVKPDELGAVLTETLRQTPDLICPYEVRGSEASAVLSIAQTGHQVITTIHAATPAAAVRRMALLATQGGAYPSYDAALIDTTAGFPIVMVIDRAPTGHRYVQTIAAVLAIEDGRSVEQAIIPLYEASVADYHTIRATMHVDPTRPETFPPCLHRFLYRIEGLSYLRSERLSSVEVERAIDVAESIKDSDPVRAFERLQTAWRSTRSMQLLPMANNLFYLIQSMQPHPMPGIHRQHEELIAALRTAWHHRRWDDALKVYSVIEPSLYGYLMLPDHLPDPVDSRQTIAVPDLRRHLEEYTRHVRLVETIVTDCERFLREGQISRADELIRRVVLPLLPTDLGRQVRMIQYRILRDQGLDIAAACLAAELGIPQEDGS